MPAMMPIFPACSDGLRLGLGGAPLGNLFRAISDAAAGAIVDAALADGCRSFDTAPHYGHGLSEHRVGHALRGTTQPVAISTKVGRLLTPNTAAARAQHGYVDILPFDQQWDYSARGVRRSVEDSLQRLGRARLGAVFIHDCDADTHGDAYPSVLEQVVTEALPELARMKREGLIAAAGLGVNDVAVCLDVLARADLDCLLLAGRYTLLDQAALASLMPLCVARGVRVAVGGVFNSGILATGTRGDGATPMFNYAPAQQAWIDRARAIERICADHAVPLRAAALQFPLAHPAVEIVLVGAQQIEHWGDARTMMQHSIPARFWQAMRAARVLPDDAPTPPDA